MALGSIIVSTFDRYEHLLYLLDHYGNADLPNLDAIFISWVRAQTCLNKEMFFKLTETAGPRQSRPSKVSQPYRLSRAGLLAKSKGK